ncbi:hypothetical protein [Tardiphaga sp. 841_E9_N1_2]|uniref:hypothetical protein n=1 Tax=Tardiphaga sp. 841_E9_N1_2 TaxID=3240762 RepID=UPI003F1FC5E4
MEFSPQGYTPDGIAMFGKDEQSMVRFFRHPMLSKIQSEEKGLPVYVDVDMIEVIQPGEKESVQVLATEWHKRRFQKQWQAFQDGIEQTAVGTPLDHLFPSEPGTILTLKSFNIHTVQQLAGLTDSAIGNLPMGRQLVDKAKAYLGSADGGSEFHAMQRRIAELEAKVANQAEAPPEKRGPGRPPKAQGE